MSPPAFPGAPAHEEHSPEIPGLLGLRAVMGTWVVADHLRDWMVTLLPSLRPLTPLLNGGIALDTFFILSGFVIAHVHARRLASFDGRSYGRFLWARFARLWPAHVFALGVAAVVAAAYGSTMSGLGGATTHYSVGTFLGNVAMLQAVHGVDAWNPPSWSVSVEMCAYVLFPVVAALVVRARRVTATALAIAVVVVMALVLPPLYASSPAVFFLGLMWVRPCLEIVLGCALWAAWRRGIVRHWGWDLVAVSTLGGVALLAYHGLPGATGFVAVALLGLLVVAVTGATGPVSRVLSAPAVRWAGRTSYSRYLLHLPVLFALQLVLPSDGVADAPRAVRVGVVVVWFVAVFAAGGLTHRFVEEPARRWLRRRTGPASSTYREQHAAVDDRGETPRGPGRRRVAAWAAPRWSSASASVSPSSCCSPSPSPRRSRADSASGGRPPWPGCAARSSSPPSR